MEHAGDWRFGPQYTEEYRYLEKTGMSILEKYG